MLTDGIKDLFRVISLQRVDHFEERKAVKIGIARANLADSVLPHKNSCMGVVKKVPVQMRNLFYDLLRDIGMLWGRNKHPQAGRGK